MDNPGLKILIVEDDNSFRAVLEKSLKDHKHVPTSAMSGKQAQDLMNQHQFDLVISDIKMPEMSGIQLLQWIKTNRSTPVILMTGFSDIIETQEAVQIGASGFLTKPFKTDDLISTITGAITNQFKTEMKVDLDSEYCKIAIDDFISGKQIMFDIYIRITQSKYIKIAHAGEDLSKDRIHSYKSKDIRFLYMKKDDYRNYLGLNLALLKRVAGSKQLEHAKKVKVLKHTSEILLQKIYINGISSEDFSNAKAVVENAVSIISEDSDATNLLTALSKHTDFLYSHCLGVSLFAALIGKAMGWTSPSTVFKVSIGGLLHDIGKKEIPRSVLEKTRSELTPEDVALLESHPTRGAEILGQMQFLPPELVQIVHQHHENCLGYGYPLRLKRSKIHPLAKVVSIANDFCNLVIPNPNCPGMPAEHAVRKMETQNQGLYDESAILALKLVLKIPA